MMIPSSVRKVRSLLANIDCKARRVASQRNPKRARIPTYPLLIDIDRRVTASILRRPDSDNVSYYDTSEIGFGFNMDCAFPWRKPRRARWRSKIVRAHV